MNQTENLSLPQWEADDRIMRTDFNDAMANIDAGVRAANDAAAAAPKIAAGSYTGDGSAERKIPLDFTPKVVFVCPMRAHRYYSAGVTTSLYGGLATPEAPVRLDGHDGTVNPVLAVTANGFKVYYRNLMVSSNYYVAASNNNNTVYQYLAIG